MIRYLYENLIFTGVGTVWGVWRVEPPQFRTTAQAARLDVLERTERFIKALPAGEAMLLSLCPQTDPARVLERMLDGVDPDRCPDWQQACVASARTLAEFVLCERTHWLLLPIPVDTTTGAPGGVASAVSARLAQEFGLPAGPVSAARVRAYVSSAQRIAQGIPGLRLRPATSGEVLWMWQRAPLRGLDEPALPITAPDTTAGGGSLRAGRLTGPSLMGLGQVHLDEGGKNGRRLVSPFSNRYVVVSHPDHPNESSVQAFLCLAEMPSSFTFPGCAYLEQVDDLGFAVDWCVRLRVVPRDQAEAATRRRSRELAEQRLQRGDDEGHVPDDLERAVGELDDYRAQLTASASEVEVQASTIFCVFSDRAEYTEEYAQVLAAEMAPADYQVVRPVGAQIALYTAMLPGTPAPRVVREFTQYLFARDFAMSVPVSGTAIGDPAGGLLGLRMDSAGVSPVLHDPGYAPRVLHTSASTACLGELGAGKSVTMKLILDLIVRRGGRGLVIDRTPSAEWARFAGALPGTTQVLSITQDAGFSLDPLRCFEPEEGQRYAEGFLGLLLGIEPLSTESAILSESIARVLDSDVQARSLSAVTTELRDRTDPRSRDLARRLTAAARLDLAATVFDPTRTPLTPEHTGNGTVASTGASTAASGGVSTVVFATHGIALPDRDEVAGEQGMRQLEPEKRLGRALMYLVAALCRTRAFSTPGFTGVFLDECYWLTSSAEGEKLALELVRDGRKHNAAVYLGAHDPADLGGEVISGLLGQRFLFRHRDARLAERGLAWLGLDPDEHLTHLVTRDLSPVDLPPDQAADRAGECLYRDARGRTGLVKVLLPSTPGMAEAIRTDPDDQP